MQRKNSCDDRHRTPRTDGHHQKLVETRKNAAQSEREHGPVNNLISDIYPTEL